MTTKEQQKGMLGVIGKLTRLIGTRALLTVLDIKLHTRALSGGGDIPVKLLIDSSG